MLRNHAASGFTLPNRQMGTRVEESFERRYALRARSHRCAAIRDCLGVCVRKHYSFLH